MPAHALFVEVRMLAGAYHGAGDWPPSPFRLFQALVAGAYGGRWVTESREPKDAAFRWLEQLEAPQMVAPESFLRAPITYFVPNNDRDAVAGDPRGVGDIRAAKTVTPRLVGSDATILYAWPFDEGLDDAKVVCALADRLHTLGHGVDAACASARVMSWADAELRLRAAGRGIARPSAYGGPDDPQCPTDGSLDSLVGRESALRTRFELRGSDTLFRQPPKPRYRSVAFNRAGSRMLFDLRSREGGAAFRPVPQEEAASVVAAALDAAARRLRSALPDRVDEIAGALLGFSNEGPLERARVIALPSIGHRHASPSIRRITVEVPAACALSERDIAWALSGAELTALDPNLILEPAEDESMLRHYGSETLARRWCTVTPVVLDSTWPAGRVSGELRARHNESAAEEIGLHLRAAGYDTRGLTVRVQREPFHAKGARADAFHPKSFDLRTLHHVELTFVDPIAGPLMAGRGVFQGLGLFRPADDLNRPRAVVAGAGTEPRTTQGEVARFSIERGLPVERTIELADVLRLAAMAQAGDPVPRELSGRDDAGPLREHHEHVHAFFLPEDSDGDGIIDRVLVYCRTGFSSAARKALKRLTRLWISPDRRAGEPEGEWESRIALEAIDAVDRVHSSNLLGKGTHWVSVTPYLKPRFDKKRPGDFEALVESYRNQILREWRTRFPHLPIPAIEPFADNDGFLAPTGPGGSLEPPRAFVRTRRGKGGAQPDTSGGFFRLTFDRPVAGPIALGKHAHFGMGVFRCSPMGGET